MFQKSVSPSRIILITKGPKTSKCLNSERPQHKLSIITNKLIHTVLFFRFTLILSYPLYLGPTICYSLQLFRPKSCMYFSFQHFHTTWFFTLGNFPELTVLIIFAMNEICEVSHNVILLLPPTPSPILCWNGSIGLSTLLPNALVCGMQH
jgi:hypothetical protein